MTEPVLDSGQQARDTAATAAGTEQQAPATLTNECDLVMKGGITSGVVYPSAIRRLSEDYRFRNIGGASAGAIAAVVAAACEYRRRGGVDQAFDGLTKIADEVRQDGFIQRLFQPTPAARPALEVGLAYVTSKKGKVGRILDVIAATLRRAPQFLLSAVLGALLWLAFLVFTSWALARAPFSWVDAVSIALFAVVALFGFVALIGTAVALALTRFGLGVNSALRNNRLGMCSGLRQQGCAQPALTDWLHEKIQGCAGLELDEPLTFAMLAGEDEQQKITLRLITTDLSYARPVDLPLADDPPSKRPAEKGLTTSGETIYYFDPSELAGLFPKEVVDAMVSAGAPETLEAAPPGKMLYRLPGSKLPIVVAARLSLSFPMLLSTVPLWSEHPSLPYLVEHCMSDGGICSNFPIHFFDGLFPNRPTFGLDLEPYPDAKLQQALLHEPYIVFGDEPHLPGFSSVEGVITFFRQLLNAARNWRDNLQSELPGYRDRICQIRLTKVEGGLNLNMPKKVVDGLVARGTEAGDTICAAPPEGFDWNRHRFTRYLTLMQALQDGLKPAQASFAQFVSDMPHVPPDWPTYDGHEPPWWTDAAPLTTAFLNSVTWGKSGPIDFDENAPPPDSELRITPSV